MNPPTELEAWSAAHNAMQTAAQNSGPTFCQQAKEFVLDYLRQRGRSSGEEITDACKRAGIVPHSDKAFGAVYHALSRRGKIVKAGTCLRRKGNNTAGGTVWKLANT